MLARSAGAGSAALRGRSDSSGSIPAARRYAGTAAVVLPPPEPTPATYVESVNTIGYYKPSAFSVGDSFAAWEDGSEYANHFVASGDARPTLVSSWLDGNSGVRFDGAANLLRRYSFTGLGAGSKPCILCVCTADDPQPQTNGTLLYAHDLDSPNIDQLMIVEYRVANGGLRTMARLGSGPSTISAQAAHQADGSPHWIMCVASNGSNLAETWVDGTLLVTASSSAAGGLARTVTHVSLGGTDQAEGNPSTRWWKGTMGELLIFDGVPTSGEFEALFDGILRPRWPSLTWEFA